MKKTQVVIVGAGIVGMNISYLLQKRNIDHIILEKTKKLLNNASGAAGAFVSPIYNTKSPIGQMLQTAFAFARDFYSDFPSCVDKGIVHIDSNKTTPPSYDTPFAPISLYENEGFLLQEAMVVDPIALAKKLTKNAVVAFDTEVASLVSKGGQWCVNEDLLCEQVILTTGHESILCGEDYIDLRGVSGTKIKIHSPTQIPHNVQKDVFFSKSQNGEVIIGATHHRKILDKHQISQDTQALIAQWQQITRAQEVTLIETKTGVRACSKDYFPIIGQIVDAEKTLTTHPSIRHGTKVPEDKIMYKTNLYICSGVGGKGYTLAPYLAKLLLDNIFAHQKIPPTLNTYSRFLRYYRKNKQF